jgi:RHS repeat-associated protein
MTITYDYDPLYRLTSASYSAGAEYEYTYDAVGNRQTMTSPDGETSYTYDAANRLTSVGGVAYTWDANGNLTSDGVRSYSYDHANRLTQVTQGSVTAEYVYNGDGVRTSKTVAGETTEYALDLLATLPVVISDTDAVYLYGLDIIAQQQSERLYYVHDGLGSVRQLVDTTGQVETNYAYDPFGVPVVEGDGSNPYRYTGEAWDAEVELLYLRARYYQPEVGRFLTKDPWAGGVWRPGTLNAYVYVANNSVNIGDPAGLDGGGPGGICPECKEKFHRLTLPTEPEPEIPSFEEWVRHWEWPDPWGQGELASADAERIPPIRERLISEAKKMYEDRGFANIEVYAWSKQDNPLDPNLMNAGCLGGLTVRAIANSLQPPFNILIEAFRMNWQRRTNYELYFLTLLMDDNADEVKLIRWRVYEWWREWRRLFQGEPEECFHPVVAD